MLNVANEHKCFRCENDEGFVKDTICQALSCHAKHVCLGKNTASCMRYSVSFMGALCELRCQPTLRRLQFCSRLQYKWRSVYFNPVSKVISVRKYKQNNWLSLVHSGRAFIIIYSFTMRQQLKIIVFHGWHHTRPPILSEGNTVV